ncbi:alpha/beta-hydrolase [Atractiella rhizophila]|nr:alpha/beta-hydrolase [Atractiella rhizophila]
MSSNPFSFSKLAEGSPKPPSIRVIPSITASSNLTLLLLEGRPTEGGRGVITRLDAEGKKVDLVGKDRRVGSRVHEYGGGAWELLDAKKLVWTDQVDMGVYITSIEGGKEERIVPEIATSRYADFHAHPKGTYILAIHEDHSKGSHLPVNTLSLLSVASSQPKTIVSGNSFYSSPRFSPSGTHFCYITWNGPDMPFEATELWVAEFQADTGNVGMLKRVAGKLGGEELVDQPLWIDEKRLGFICDRSGWKQFYIYDVEKEETSSVLEKGLEVDFAGPSWNLGRKEWAVLNDPARMVGYEHGKLYVHDVERKSVEEHPLEGVAWVEEIHAHPTNKDAVVFVSLNERAPPSACVYDLSSRQTSIIYATGETVDPSFVSTAKMFSFPTSPTSLHDPSPTTAHARFFPPVPKVDNPPCLISVHGGPTGSSKFYYNPTDVQAFTSNGIAVCQVEYGGTTGFGRAYRKRLDEGWGIVDIADAENAAKYLIEQGWVDGKRIGIVGSSSGGLTVLLSLCKSSVWTAGISHYGICDLSLLMQDTHKFESSYVSIFPPKGPLFDKAIHDRSAINFIENIKAPILLLQGLDDKVVLPNQAYLMKEKLEEKGGKVKLVTFEGEGHGFRKKETIERVLVEQMAFLKEVWNM